MREKKKKGLFFAQAITILLLISVGIGLIGWTFRQFQNDFLKNADDQLYQLAGAVDRNMDSLLQKFDTSLAYIINRNGFEEAERIYVEKGETEQLLIQMRENLLAEDSMIRDVLLIDEKKTMLSLSGQKAFYFYEEAGFGNISPCVAEDGSIYLAIVHESKSGLSYAALMDLNLFYEKIVDEDLEIYNWIIMTDDSGEILIYRQKDHLVIEEVDASSGATCGQEGVDTLLSCQELQTAKASTYEYLDQTSDRKYTARMAVLPTSKTENGILAIGIVTNYEKAMKMIHVTTTRFVVAGIMTLFGIVLLIFAVIYNQKKAEEGKRELELLKQKNEELEKITQRTRQLAHHQRLETIGTLTSGIAHEFNNLLAPIMGYSMLTLEQLPPEEEDIYDNVVEIYQASLKAKDIVTRLSELSRKSSDGHVLQKVYLDNVVKKVLHVAKPVKPEEVQIITELTLGNKPILGNETQISQLILNLVLNGFHAIGDQKGYLCISTSEEEGNAVIGVQDTGSGMSEEVRKHIFEPFFTTKEAGKGTGLGLAIVDQIVSEHKGKIEVESTEGKGTAFLVYLPLTEEEQLH